MQRRFMAASAAVILAAFSLTLVGCGQVGVLRARKAFKEANVLYQQGDWKRAAERYEEVLANDPTFATAFFYLANSYDQLYKPSRKGEAVNDSYLTKALENYRKSADQVQDPKTRKLALEFLVSAYTAADKVNDPGQAEPLVLEMIKLDPTEPSNYYTLAKMYEDAGRYEDAEQSLLKAKESKPTDSGTYLQLASYYNRQGEFDKTMAALNERTAKEPTNPEAFYTVAAYYWEKAYRDFKLRPEQKLEYISLGYKAVDKALELKSDYLDAINRKELLKRAEALVIKDPARQQQLTREADALRARYDEVKKKTTGK